MLEVILHHSSLLFESEESLPGYMQVVLKYCIVTGNMVVVEFILDHFPILLDASLPDEEEDGDDSQIYNPLLRATVSGQLE